MIRRLSRVARVEAQQRTHRLSTLPILVLCLNDICNSRCVACAIWENDDRIRDPGRRQMTDDLLASLYSRLEAWKPDQVLLTGGEPMMHPRFGSVVDELDRRGIEVLVATNGLLLGACPKATLGRIREIYVSFDAPDRESYVAIRGVDGFGRLKDGIGRLVRLSTGPRVVARATVQRANARRIVELVDRAREFGFDRISFLGADTSSEAFGRGRPDHAVDNAAIRPGRRDLEAIKSTIDALRERPDDGFIESGTQSLDRIRRRFLAGLGEGPTPRVRCNAPWVSAVIDTDGGYRGCFFHPVIGRFDAINAPGAVAFREALDVESDPTCRTCVCSKRLSVRALWGMH